MNSSITETEFENLLKKLPRQSLSQKADQRFLNELRKYAAPTHIGFFQIFTRRFAFAGSLALLLLVITGTVFAYQPSITRGHFMYGWKKLGEQIELAASLSPITKVNTHLRFSDRRLEEAEKILEHSPALAWIAPTARAHEGEIHLDTDQERHFVETLHEMHVEVALASSVVEQKISAIEEAKTALKRIEDVTDRHITLLRDLTNKTPPKVQPIVVEITIEQDEHLSAVVEAKEELEENKEQKIVHVILSKKEQKTIEREQEATEELQESLNLFQNLPASERARFEKKLEMAKEALSSGKLGRAKGLSRALKQTMQHAIEKSTSKDDRKGKKLKEKPEDVEKSENGENKVNKPEARRNGKPLEEEEQKVSHAEDASRKLK